RKTGCWSKARVTRRILSMNGLKLPDAELAGTLDEDKADSANCHEDTAHCQCLTIVDRAGLTKQSEDDNWHGWCIRAGNEDRCAKFAHADGESKSRADD